MLIPAISFQGRCDEAITFYKEALGAQVKNVAYYKDAPKEFVMDVPPNFVMHSEVLMFGAVITMTDGATAPITGDYFSLVLTLDTAEDVTAAFNKIADGGRVIEALAPQFWASLCGDVEDRFGINWHIATRD